MKCPICNRPAVWEGNEFRPFCSERCKMIDLGAWASEEYGVPSDEPANFEEMPTGPLTSPDGSDSPPRH